MTKESFGTLSIYKHYHTSHLDSFQCLLHTPTKIFQDHVIQARVRPITLHYVIHLILVTGGIVVPWSFVDISTFLVMATGPGDEDGPFSFRVVVKTMFGEHFELAVSNSDTIKSVKQKITNKLNIPEEGFTLLHNTRFVWS